MKIKKEGMESVSFSFLQLTESSVGSVTYIASSIDWLPVSIENVVFHLMHGTYEKFFKRQLHTIPRGNYVSANP